MRHSDLTSIASAVDVAASSVIEPVVCITPYGTTNMGEDGWEAKRTREEGGPLERGKDTGARREGHWSEGRPGEVALASAAARYSTRPACALCSCTRETALP